MDISTLIENSKYGVNEIKLKDLLAAREQLNQDPLIKTLFPPIEMGSITLVDQIVLLSLAQIIKPETIIEIGTFLGYSASLLAMNTEAKIFTIDLPKSEGCSNLTYDANLIRSDGDENDNFLRKKQADEGEIYIQNLNENERKRVILVKADSTSINFAKEFKTAQFAFIDGGHERGIVEKDTLNARSIITNGVIIWHDYGSQIHSGVTDYLSSIEDRKIFHVKGSLCAFEIITGSES
ncbi:MAG: class I SAM-dependent methyltransferase [Gammaproteobacteria bacterium]|nr:class I SAM-dependent methyltransferase [Gammaproteobacteria bacterium]